MRWLWRRKPSDQVTAVFREHREELYWLAFLLTGDEDLSIAAFDLAFDQSAWPVRLRAFALDWARRLVISNSLDAIRLHLEQGLAEYTRDAGFAEEKLPLIDAPNEISKAKLERALLRLAPLQRCAVILLIFERIPIRDACTWLRTDEQTVRFAQRQGVLQLTRHLSYAADLREAACA